MKLKDYRVNVLQESRAKLGKRIGITGITVYRHETSGNMPNRNHLQKYFEVSGGLVTANDFADQVGNGDA